MKPLIIKAAAFTLLAGGLARGDYSQEVSIATIEAAGRPPGKFPAAIAQERTVAAAAPALVLKAGDFKHYVDDFNKNDNELYKGTFPNAVAWDFLKANIPLFDCPDEDIQRTYYFRWWTYRKHIKKTPAGFIVDEFLPDVAWAGKFNSINCAAGHHIYEGRWLRDPRYMSDYTAFWFGGGGNPRGYSFWAADSVWQLYCVSGDRGEAMRLLPDLIANYVAWEKSNRDGNGLYWQIDDRDGMEASIGGSGYRVTHQQLSVRRCTRDCSDRRIGWQDEDRQRLSPKSGGDQETRAGAVVERQRPVLHGPAARREPVTRQCARIARFHALVF